MNSFLAERRRKSAKRSRAMAGYRRLRARMFDVVCFLVLAGTAGALILEHSYALAQQGRPAAQRANAAAGSTENGKTVFSGQKCETCHGNQGQGGTGAVAGPQIAALTMTLPMFIERVRNPKAPMPPYSAGQVSDAALSDVYAFLKSIPASVVTTGAGNAQDGKRLFVSAGCQFCHNGEGQGGGPGPRLAPNPNMLAFAAFVHQCREPSNQMPPYTSKVLSDAQLADIYAFLQSVPKPPEASSIPLLQ